MSTDDLSRLRLLSINELVDLGVGSRATVYRMIQRGDLPCVRRGRSVRVRVTDYEAWLEQGGSTSNVLPFRQRRRRRESA